MARKNISSNQTTDAMIKEWAEAAEWDYTTELVFHSILGILAIPTNLFLLWFYIEKVRRYKNLRHLNARYARIANSFHTYMIEICSFDIVIVAYLMVDSSFKQMHANGMSQFESVYDISNFACKFFTYIVRISSAMINWLVFLLALNRCFLVIFRYKPTQISSHRLCFNTKYLTLFLFCICTIANVFRLELLNLGADSTSKQLMQGFDSLTSQQDFLAQLTEHMDKKVISCSPTFSMNDMNYVSISINIYSIMFTILPSFGNLIIGCFIIKKRAEYREKLNLLLQFCYQSKMNKRMSLLEGNNRVDMVRPTEFELEWSKESYYEPTTSKFTSNLTDEIIEDIVYKKGGVGGACGGPASSFSDANNNNSLIVLSDLDIKNRLDEINLNEFHAEFLKTCLPCIAFSLTQVILILPFSILEIINQNEPNLALFSVLQYMTYIRYLFYSSKFYLLFLVSYKFRREVIKIFTFKKILKFKKLFTFRKS